MAIGFKMGGLFGRPPCGTPRIGEGVQQEPHAYAQQAPAPEGGSKTKHIIGIIGDALLGLGGQQGIYGPMMLRKRLQEQAMQRQQQMAEQSRQWAREDKQWEWDNAPPKTNDTIEDFNWYKNLSEQDRATYERMRPVYRQGPDGQFYRVEPQQSAPQVLGSELPPGWSIEGGPTPQASGTFQSAFGGGF